MEKNRLDENETVNSVHSHASVTAHHAFLQATISAGQGDEFPTDWSAKIQHFYSFPLCWVFLQLIENIYLKLIENTAIPA